jgi:hypothetical protein
MSNVLQSPFRILSARRSTSPSFIQRFLSWSRAQQHDRFLWIGIGLALQGCALAPITLYFVSLVGMNLALFCVVLTAMAMVVVTNLAALPTRITIPVLAASVIIDLGVIITSLAMLGAN